MNMSEIAALIDTLAADFGEDVPTAAITGVVVGLAADSPDDDAGSIETAARTRLTEMRRGDATRS